MSKVIETRHIERTMQFLTTKAAEYREKFEDYANLDMPELAEWHKARGEAFLAAVEYLEVDLDIFAEEQAI